MTTAIDEKLTGLLHAEQEKLKELIDKANKDLILHVRQTENLTSEKFDFIKDLLMKVDQKAGQMATTDMIDTLKEDSKNLKSKFEMEFEQFQQYLKEQTSIVTGIHSRVSVSEKKIKLMHESIQNLQARGHNERAS